MGAIFRFFEGLLDPFESYDDSKAPPSGFGEFYRVFMWPARRLVIASVILGACAGIADAMIISFASEVVNAINRSEVGAAQGAFWREHSDRLMLIAALVMVVRPLIVITDRLIAGQSYWPNMVTMVRWRTHRHMLRQSIGFYSDDFAGRIANKQMQLAPSFNDIIMQLLDAIWYAFVFLIASAVLVSSDSPSLLAPLSIWFAAYVAVAAYFVPRIARAGKKVADARSVLAGRIVDSYTNIQTVKLFAHTTREEVYAREALEDMRAVLNDQERLITWLTIVLTMINTLLILGLVGGATYLWSVGAATIGAVAATATLVFRLQGMTDWIMWTLTMLFQNVGTVMEGVELVSQPLRLKDASDAKQLQVSQARIRFEDVSHQYGRTGDRAGMSRGRGVDGVTLDIAPGQRVGLVGRSGAGKSTLMNALLRFFDVDGGRILIDGQDVKHVTQESLRAQIGMVTQDTSLLHRSILDNILYGARDATLLNDRDAALAAAEAAARRVSAHEFILDLEDQEGRTGYDAFVGERGVKLSGGQRQRIALARVALKNAPILVLDEATSALDSEVEAAILEAMEDLMAGKTVIAIAHRLSTIAQMDRIVVLDQGRIAEQGGHEALLTQGGIYASLWSRQSGGFLALDSAGGETAAQ
ncbi:MAG: ABC transporter ATP-binding protein/permease [Neomegalonema sp.]|nr:ABC transporter ATP-binding protein/permease [Neomegalonema sp.]